MQPPRICSRTFSSSRQFRIFIALAFGLLVAVELFSMIIPLQIDSEVNFEVDAVITWVDPSDETWRKTYVEAAKKHGIHVDLKRLPTASGFEDELFFNLIGLIQNLKWIRRLYLVTQRPQKPVYLDEMREFADFDIRVVHHDEFIPKAYLPNFQSNLFELFLDQIPGISEHFVYFNDDMIVLRPLAKGHFFTSKGQAIVPTTHDMPQLACALEDLEFSCTIDYTRKRLKRLTATTRQHGLYAVTRRLLRDLRTEIGQSEVDQLGMFPHRRPNVINPLWAAVNIDHPDLYLTMRKPYRFLFLKSASSVKRHDYSMFERDDAVCVNILDPSSPEWLKDTIFGGLESHFTPFVHGVAEVISERQNVQSRLKGSKTS